MRGRKSDLTLCYHVEGVDKAQRGLGQIKSKGTSASVVKYSTPLFEDNSHLLLAVLGVPLSDLM